jgi:acetyltransferase-like isoleucine patch superfamily enzyme
MPPFQRLSRRLSLSLNRWLESSKAALEHTTLPKFATPAPGLVMQNPREIENPERIAIGRDVKLGPGAVLRARAQSPGSWLAHPDGQHIHQTFDSRITIGDRVTATGALQLVAYARITIEDEVMFASNIYISDGLHSFERGDVPYKYQGIFRIAPITIGYGSWIGQNVTVMPGVTIGKLCVIGAHSVVTKSIPDGSLAIGAPAKVVKRWDAAQGAWIPVTPAS